jgi:hypothetical protein
VLAIIDVSEILSTADQNLPILTFDAPPKIVTALRVEQLSYAQCCDVRYYWFQHEDRWESYKFVKGLRYQKDHYGKKIVDTSDRPRLTYTLPNSKGAIYTSSAHYWFGDIFFEIIPKQHILKFDQARRVAELPNGIVYVNLFEDIFDAHLPGNQARQIAFKDYLELK